LDLHPLRRSVLLALASSGALALAGCKIVALDEEGQAKAVAGFDAEGFAEGIWTEKVLPHLSSTAKPLPEVIAAVQGDLNAAGEQFGYRAAAEGAPWTFIVSGAGAVTAKNTQSRAGTLTVALDGTSPPIEVAIQIGPVVRGNSIRDSLPFVSFKDFTNQLEFADVGKAFNAMALAAISETAQSIAEGQKVAFIGTMSLNTKSDKILVTPVSLEAAG
jgi:predicted lipoprotein